jgi:hypothetical protein
MGPVSLATQLLLLQCIDTGLQGGVKPLQHLYLLQAVSPCSFC